MKRNINLKSAPLKEPEKQNSLLESFKYQFVLDNSNIGVWEWDAISDKVYYSKLAKYNLGYSDFEDLSEDHWNNRVHPEDFPSLKERLTKHIDKQTPLYKSEHRLLCKDGSYKWFLDCGKIIERDASGNPKRGIGTLTDITESKENEKVLINNLDIITNQNQKLTNFAHIVTHNLKEYAGNFESLLQFYDEAENDLEKNELIDHLKTVSKSLSKTISSLNEIVLKQSMKKIERSHLNIYNQIEDTIKILDLEIQEKQAVINNNINKNITIYANSAYLESIIQNLATNALKYSHPQRTPIISIDSHIFDDGLLMITVTDNGIGIDLEKHGKDIFGLYRTFHGNENAEGVGLYLTKTQIETLGGNITVKSIVNVGTTFTITMDTKRKPA
ncbi:sensor histidine kinase [Xanthomarina sp. F2636L]|uniref:sensor histidine kinase n=1 Tax=Xanthomarina sp. F2636L TaxID=2996018 RepID=UPI00225E1553|nr:ATP-binding protein [Xanthomarina sp. F2636L]MCX7550441.1 PAS domain-containing protein [Xanthomarina sp. F2636L]